MTKRSELEPRIITEWLRRSPERRCEGDVLDFYLDLERNDPELLSFQYPGDKYQAIKSIIRNHVKKNPEP